MNKTIAIVSASALAFMMSAGIASAQVMMYPPMMGFGGDVIVYNSSQADVSNDISVEAQTGDNDADGGDAGAGARGGDARATNADAEGGNGGDGGDGGRGGSIVTGAAIGTSNLTNDVNRNDTEVNYEDCGCEPAYDEYYHEVHAAEADASLWYDQYESDSSLTMGGSLHTTQSASSDYDDDYSEADTASQQSASAKSESEEESEEGAEMSASQGSDYSANSNYASDSSEAEQHNNSSSSSEDSQEGSSTTGGHHHHGGTTEWDNYSATEDSSREGASNSSESESGAASESGSQGSSASASAWDNYESEEEASSESQSSEMTHEMEHDVSLDTESASALDAEFGMNAESSEASNKGGQEASAAEYHEVEYSKTASRPAPRGNVMVSNMSGASVSNTVEVEAETGDNDAEGGNGDDAGRGGDARAVSEDNGEGQVFYGFRGYRGGHHGSQNDPAYAEGGNGGDAGNGAKGGSVVTGIADSLSNALTIVNQSFTRVNR